MVRFSAFEAAGEGTRCALSLPASSYEFLVVRDSPSSMLLYDVYNRGFGTTTSSSNAMAVRNQLGKVQ